MCIDGGSISFDRYDMICGLADCGTFVMYDDRYDLADCEPFVPLRVTYVLAECRYGYCDHGIILR